MEKEKVEILRAAIYMLDNAKLNMERFRYAAVIEGILLGTGKIDLKYRYEYRSIEVTEGMLFKRLWAWMRNANPPVRIRKETYPEMIRRLALRHVAEEW